jgi:predicted GIY-YIG superfamily endonuclease
MNADVKPSLIDLEGDNDPTGRKQLELQRERLSERDYMYCVYWIHAQHHTDISTQGYVGITKNFDERVRAHNKNRKKTPLTDAIRKYGKANLVYSVLHRDCPLSEALSLECQLRPEINIGWNLQKGGELGVDSSWYDKHENKEAHSKATSDGTRMGILKKDSKEARSERAKLNWKLSDKYIGISKGDKNPRAILTEDMVRDIKYTHIANGLSNADIATMYGVKPYLISFIRTGKNWSYV